LFHYKRFHHLVNAFQAFFIHFLYKNAFLFAFYTLCCIAADLFSLPAVYRTDCPVGSLIPRLF